jgi:drug/metabolite transporter (DMT)-like permease
MTENAPIAADGPSPGQPGAESSSRDRLWAIALMMIAITFFSALDATAKYLVTHDKLTVTQVAWSRFFVQFAGLLILVPAAGVLTVQQLFRTNGLKLQLVRSVLMAATTVFNFLALEHLRLDQTITIVFLTPLVVALLAGPLLGEWVGWRRMVAIAVGFGGVLVALNPSVGGIHYAVMYSFLAMFAYALFMILTRYMAGLDPPMVTLFYSMFVGTIFGAPFAMANWHAPPDIMSWLLLGTLGILGGLGHWLFLHAYRLAPASVVAPFLYFQLLSMIAFGYAIFGDKPDSHTMIGAAIVVASGIYLFHREQVTRAAEQKRA